VGVSLRGSAGGGERKLTVAPLLQG